MCRQLTTANTEDIVDLVQADLSVRKRVGVERYGVPLRTTPTPQDYRDMLVEAYEEALDLVVYLKKTIETRGVLPHAE
jgi:hypothetical protein